MSILFKHKINWQYAIGEVILIFIGISLALTFSNWNENQKERQTENEILVNLKNTLVNDLVNLNKAQKTNRRIESSISVLIHAIEKDLPYHDSLKYHFGNTNHIWSFWLDRSSFETLLSHGLNIILNHELRQQISTFYNLGEGTFLSSQERYRDYIFEASQTVYRPRFDQFWDSNYKSWIQENDVYSGDFDPSSVISVMTPINFEDLKKDVDYVYHLKTLRNLYYWLIEFESKNMIDAIEDLMGSINNELMID